MARVYLYADDSDAMRQLVRMILEPVCDELLVAEDGEQALELLQRRAGEIDLAILDNKMPKLSGAEVVRQVRASGAVIPLVIISGDPSSVTGIDGLERVQVLQKPVMPDALVEVVEELMKDDA